MKIIISPKAEKQLKKISTVDKIVVVRKIRSLPDAIKNYNQNLKKLKGHDDFFRLRIGSMRIIFRVKLKEIYIVSIGHRKDIYKAFS